MSGKPLQGIESYMEEQIKSHLESHLAVIERVKNQQAGVIADCAQIIIDAMLQGKKLLVMGNGGSAADAQHMAAEFVGRFLCNRQALPAIALTTDTSILTAVGNDFGFETIFSRQIEALANAGDVVLGISTSGNSANVLAGLQAARQKGCRCLGLAGGDGGQLPACTDLSMVVPSEHTPLIQEAHLTIIHIICDLVERAIVNA